MNSEEKPQYTNLKQLHSTAFLRPSFLKQHLMDLMEPVVDKFATDINDLGKQDLGALLIKEARELIVEWDVRSTDPIDAVCLECRQTKEKGHLDDCRKFRWITIYEDLMGE